MLLSAGPLAELHPLRQGAQPLAQPFAEHRFAVGELGRRRVGDLQEGHHDVAIGGDDPPLGEQPFGEGGMSLAREAHAAFAEGLLAEGRIVPADRDIVVALLEVADTAPAEFADGETVFGERLRKWLSSLPKRVEFGERAGGEKHAELSDPETIAERAIAYQAEMRRKGIIVRADEAVRRVVGG